MKTFKQFISEEIQEVRNLEKLIEDNCAFFLSESKRNGFLIRGMKKLDGASSRATVKSFAFPGEDEDEQGFIWERTVRHDRRPADTEPESHKLLDDWFNKEFGVRARSTTLFCVGDTKLGRADIKQYGDLYIILPIGEFKYIWSPKVQDLFAKIDDKDWTMDLQRPGEEQDPAENCNRFMNTLGYYDGDLHKVVSSKLEVMVACSKYYAIEYKHKYMLENMLGIS